MQKFAILTAGAINLKTGDSKYFNVFENAGNYPACMFMLKNGSKHMLVTGSGDHLRYNGFQVGDHPQMFHDQSRRSFPGNWKVIMSGPLNRETLAQFHKSIAIPYDVPKKGFGNKLHTHKFVNSCTFGVFK